jgi:hypothetical protein
VHLSLCRRAFGSALVILTMAVAGCGRTSGPAKIAETFRLVGDPARLSLTAGGSGRAAARANDAVGNPTDGARLHFSASDPKLLRVDAQGVVTSLGPAGRASILITSGSRSVTVPVDVFAGPAHRFEAIGASKLAIVAGTLSKDAVNVRLVDAYENPVANSRVMLEAAIDPPLSLSTATGTDGVATVTLPVITHAGHFFLNVHASDNGPVSLPLEVQVNAASPATLEAVKVLPSGPVALVPDFELVLQVRDAFGNPVPNVLVGWRTNSVSASFDPRQSLSGPDGLVRTHWQIAELKGRRATLKAYVVKNEAIRFESWIALER